jgi:hypothetical protein
LPVIVSTTKRLHVDNDIASSVASMHRAAWLNNAMVANISAVFGRDLSKVVAGAHRSRSTVWALGRGAV